MTSLMEWLSVTSIVRRSMPIPSPAVGGSPYSSASTYAASYSAASRSPLVRSSAWRRKRSAWSSGSFSSENPFATSIPSAHARSAWTACRRTTGSLCRIARARAGTASGTAGADLAEGPRGGGPGHVVAVLQARRQRGQRRLRVLADPAQRDGGGLPDRGAAVAERLGQRRHGGGADAAQDLRGERHGPHGDAGARLDGVVDRPGRRVGGGHVEQGGDRLQADLGEGLRRPLDGFLVAGLEGVEGEAQAGPDARADLGPGRLRSGPELGVGVAACGEQAGQDQLRGPVDLPQGQGGPGAHGGVFVFERLRQGGHGRPPLGPPAAQLLGGPRRTCGVLVLKVADEGVNRRVLGGGGRRGRPPCPSGRPGRASVGSSP